MQFFGFAGRCELRDWPVHLGGRRFRHALKKKRKTMRGAVLYGPRDVISVQAGEEGIRFLLVSGRPLREPIAWHGPIVMNTQDEIRQAIIDLRDGSFIRRA